MKHIFKAISLVAVVISPIVCIGQGTFQIGFDGVPVLQPGTSIYVQQYFESGMWFRPLGVVGPGNGFSHRRGGGGVLFLPDNGTAFIAAPAGSSLIISFQTGSLFGVASVDLAGYSTVVPDFSVPFVGYRPDGSTVTTNFSGTGINFRTVNFGPEWSNLTRVEIPAFGWSLDNLVLSVPEPATGALLAAGALAFSFWRARKRGTLAALLTMGAATPAMSQTFQELHGFSDRPDGADPWGGVMQAKDGNFYGTTFYGGSWGYGTAFKMTPNGEITLLISLDATNTDQHPVTSLTEANDGNFYFATVAPSRILKMTPDGALTVYGYAFGAVSELLQAADGFIYVADSGDGNFGGFISKFRPETGSGQLVYRFEYNQPQNGYDPSGGLVQARDGNFYGVTAGGGSFDYGGVYRITSNGVYTVMCSFSRGSDFQGAVYPYGRLLQASDGNFYGIAEGGPEGTVFRMTTTGVLTTVAWFDGYTGSYANGGLIEANDGNFYGTASRGGLPTDGGGTVFRMTPAGGLSLFVSFTGGYGAYPGESPRAGMIQGSDGNLYGTTANQGSGTPATGNVFRIIMPGPQLNSFRAAQQLVLSWRTNYSGFKLQSAANPASATWLDSTNQQTVGGGQFFVTNSMSGGAQFFRLKK